MGSGTSVGVLAIGRKTGLSSTGGRGGGVPGGSRGQGRASLGLCCL